VSAEAEAFVGDWAFLQVPCDKQALSGIIGRDGFTQESAEAGVWPFAELTAEARTSYCRRFPG